MIGNVTHPEYIFLLCFCFHRVTLDGKSHPNEAMLVSLAWKVPPADRWNSLGDQEKTGWMDVDDDDDDEEEEDDDEEDEDEDVDDDDVRFIHIFGTYFVWLFWWLSIRTHVMLLHVGPEISLKSQVPSQGEEKHLGKLGNFNFNAFLSNQINLLNWRKTNVKHGLLNGGLMVIYIVKSHLAESTDP